VNANLLLDPLSITFVPLITGVGSLIHICSIGYMAHDPEIWGQAGGPSR
jgi:NADH-quinone oxidoreductase subunit L